MEIIAHRGSSYLAPENTLAAFRLGWDETTTCELDVQMTRDGKLLVLHDASTRRTTGIDLIVKEHSLRELQQLEAGIWKGDRWRGERLPSLTEVLLALPAGKRLLIELKTGPEIVPELVRVLRDFECKGKLALQSLDDATCLEAKMMLPEIPVFLLVAFQGDSPGGWSDSMEEAIRLAQTGGFAGMNPNDTELLQAGAVEAIHEAGLQLCVWTVDQVDAAERLMNLGVDGLMTNRPGWLTAQLAKRDPRSS